MLHLQALAPLPSVKTGTLASVGLFNMAVQSKVLRRGDLYRPVTSKDTKERFA